MTKKNEKERLHLFYEEPDEDRWIKYDRYPRRFVRRLIRGKPSVGGVMRWFLNLKKGLDLIGVDYTINNYKELKKSENGLACVIGKQNVLSKIPKGTRIVFGPGVPSHPLGLPEGQNLHHIIVSCDWFRTMYLEGINKSIPISVWPSGIDTYYWSVTHRYKVPKRALLYDKVRWNRPYYEKNLIEPILKILQLLGVDVRIIRYGSYKESDYHKLLESADFMVFLCEHETQGFAYLQALSRDVPIFAWDRGGNWEDPEYYPKHVVFNKGVTSVPYWDDKCGDKFSDLLDFEYKIKDFYMNLGNKSPRKFIEENLTLEQCALNYLNLINSIK